MLMCLNCSSYWIFIPLLFCFIIHFFSIRIFCCFENSACFLLLCVVMGIFLAGTKGFVYIDL